MPLPPSTSLPSSSRRPPMEAKASPTTTASGPLEMVDMDMDPEEGQGGQVADQGPP